MSKNLTPEQIEIKRRQALSGYDASSGTFKSFETLVDEFMRTHKVTRGRAMVACARAYPSQHEEFIKRTNE